MLLFALTRTGHENLPFLLLGKRKAHIFHGITGGIFEKRLNTWDS